MLLAEELLLLLLDDTSGRTTAGTSRVDVALAGAVLLELTHLGRVDVARGGEGIKPGRLVVRDPTATGDDVLDEGLRRVEARAAPKPRQVLGPLAKGLRAELLTRLVGRGVLRHTEDRVLGLFTVRRWPAADSSHEDQVRRGLHDVLVVGRDPGPQESSLIALLDAVDRLPSVLPDTGLSKRELRRRAKALTGGNYAADAVRAAVQQVEVAVVAAIAASSSGGGDGDGGGGD